MQQTNKYKLNLIERDDVFSPDALNENMGKVEGAISTEAAAVTAAFQSADAALEQRVVQLEAHKFYVGSYTGNGALSRDIKLGFKPELLFIVLNADSRNIQPFLQGITVMHNGYPIMNLTEKGFHVGYTNTNSMYNINGHEYPFIALG